MYYVTLIYGSKKSKKSDTSVFKTYVQTKKKKEKLSNFVISYMEMNSFREKFLHFYLFISQMFIEFQREISF